MYNENEINEEEHTSFDGWDWEDLLEEEPERINSSSIDDDLNSMAIKSDINNLNSIIASFTDEFSQNTKLRKNSSYILFSLLGAQIMSINVMIFRWGSGKFVIDNPTIFYWFLTLIVGEIIGFVLIIVKYLFKPTDDILKEMVKLLKKQSEIS